MRHRASIPHFHLVLASLFLSLLWTGCEGSLSSLTDEELSTGIPLSKQHYDLTSLSDEDAVITPSFTNERSDTVYYREYGPVVTLDRKEKGEWKNIGYWYYTPQAAGSILSLPPGSSFDDDGHGLIELDLKETSLVDRSGFYRFNYHIYETPPAFDEDENYIPGQLLPEEERTSVPFEVIM